MQVTTLLRLGLRVSVAARDNGERGQTSLASQSVQQPPMASQSAPQPPSNVSIPVICNLSCNTAHYAAQDIGKTANLCPDDSAFMVNYKICYSCLLAKADDPRVAVNDFLEPEFSPYISYCQEQSTSSIDPSWYTSTTTWAIATYTNKDGPTETVTALVDTTVLRPDWTGFQTTTSMSPATTSQANTITSSQPLTTTNPTPEKPNTGDSTNGLSPWVWAIVGAVVVLAIIGLGILLFLYRKGKLQFIKKKWKLGKASAHSHSHELDGDSTWRTGDKPELHGESSSTAAAVTSSKELYTQDTEPKELDSSVWPVELPAEFTSTGGGVTGDLSEGRGGKEAGGEHR